MILTGTHCIGVSALRVTGSEIFDEAVAGKFRFGMLVLERIAVTCI